MPGQLYERSGNWFQGLEMMQREADAMGLAPEALPVLMRIGRRFSDALSLNLYAGVSLESELRVEDAQGRGLFKEDLEPAGAFGLSLTGRF